MLKPRICNLFSEALSSLYNHQIGAENIAIENTSKDHEGDLTVVVFPFLKFSKKSPEQTAKEIGEFLIANSDIIEKCDVIKGFLNITIKNSYWLNFIKNNFSVQKFGLRENSNIDKTIVIEYSSPNTNKPLHLGHIRNNLTGRAVANIYKANGYNVVQVNLINDRGIHICKTMLAWLKWGEGKTPEMLNAKGDTYVGDLYVKFEKELTKEITGLKTQGLTDKEAENSSVLLKEIHEMLREWENNVPEIIELWKTMNRWVLKGFEQTYRRMNIAFDKFYYESQTYLLGKDVVLEGVESKIFEKKPDNSVWVDLTNEGLDEKILLRSDGTSVYITQDIGAAISRFEEWNPSKMIYVVGNEQNYHFQVLKVILNKLGYKWADDIIHLSYGMVELPEGKMKSREGKVVDADQLMNEMFVTASELALQYGKIEEIDSRESKNLIEYVAQGALSYFILKVDAKKNIVFNPEESIDFNGDTGPFIQYTHARILSLLKKAKFDEKSNSDIDYSSINISKVEKQIATLIYEYPNIITKAADELNPSVIAQFAYELAKTYNHFYQTLQVIKEENIKIKTFRLQLSVFVAKVLESGFNILGIKMPGKM